MEAMKRVDEIRLKREAHYIQKRQVKAIVFEREKDRKEVARDITLIRSNVAGLREKKPRKSRVVVMKDIDEDNEAIEDEEMGEADSDDEQLMEDSDEEALAEINA